jgi:hypothetical protein
MENETLKLRAEVAQLQAQLMRINHDQAIESDYICPACLNEDMIRAQAVDHTVTKITGWIRATVVTNHSEAASLARRIADEIEALAWVSHEADRP